MVSIIIPTFNRARLLVQAVESVLTQTFADYEIIVADDGSTDETRAALAGFAQLLQFRYLYQPNGGRSTARNLGIANARGQWLLFLDSDDVLLPDALAQLHGAAVEHPTAGMVVGQTQFTDHRLRLQRTLTPRLAPDTPYPALIACEFFLLPGAFIVRRDVLTEVGMFDPAVEPAEDFDFALRVALRSSVVAVQAPVVQHRMHDSNTSPAKVYRGANKVARKHLALVAAAVELPAAIRRLSKAEWMRRLANNYYELGQNLPALVHYLRLLRHAPARIVDFKIQRQILACLVPARVRARIKPSRLPLTEWSGRA